MKKVTVKSLYRETEKYLDQEVIINGWVKKIRDQKNFGFIEVNDGSFFKGVQVVFDTRLSNFEEISRLSIISSIEVKGKLVKSQGAGQAFEIMAEEINVFQKADLEYPLQNKRHTFEYLRTKAHLRPRTNTFSAVFRVRSVVAYAIHKFFQENGFVYVHTPIITGSDCEGAGEMFRVTTLDLNNLPKKEDGTVDNSKDFFGKETNLTVSGQLSGETFCSAFRNIYTFGPTFRAENSNTARHASEFWMIEPEIAFADLEANMELAESMVKYIIKFVMDECPEEMEFFNNFIEKGLFDKLNNVLNSDFGRLTYTEAIDILLKSGKKFDYPVEWGIDLQSEHERYLAEEYFKKPVFLTDYPKDIKAFYMKLNPDGKTVRAMDLLAPGIGEIIGGSQREDSLEILENRITELGMKPEDYEFYLDLRRFGSFPHSGYGLGFERIIMYITGMTNIRDVIPFPRTPNNAEF
ncbi:asparagine--tRNA ligase [Fusobacterium mortiferum]|uniref:Asparagine--tRNA ligase n=2 Tax=Fusobacterium mortiferum TaxID=850 RepID=A0A414PUR8_FUSMR|nr:asparagine--tRNA ligase [Fusobacterium mortiferum]AVQ19269.1 asparagine--tRNA ligase [Fusobacterium mortiferum ATCC 9817]EEO36325.1 asparagine--tRNA ligase [Fusobacterium mortiferum ATCC 9817]MCF2628864.1 asparagine--tRNA ligase [Fusobacterium mortiferum]MCF2700290.1 asparagine--tRNA ligase [Fusobacterium mortiferum]MCI6381107.1 asparagine--tRNA ligase [Fusobacterium mortiferum]